MRDMVFIMLPVAAAVYFMVYPDQFQAVMDWMMSLVR